MFVLPTELAQPVELSAGIFHARHGHIKGTGAHDDDVVLDAGLVQTAVACRRTSNFTISFAVAFPDMGSFAPI
jgi:hypothetical protein